MCDCTKYHPCTCNKQKRPEYKIGQKWLTKLNNTVEILSIYDKYYFVSGTTCAYPFVYSQTAMDDFCVSLVPKTIKATVISYKYAENGTVYTYILDPSSPSGNTLEDWHKSAELGRIIILDEKEIELKCE